MANFQQKHTDLISYLDTLKIAFLNKHLTNPYAQPIDYDLDVKSYCILCHAAIEEFVETIASTVMEDTIQNFILHKQTPLSLVMLLHFKSSGEAFLNKEERDNNINFPTNFDYIKDRLTEIKNRFANEIFNTHGASLKYLKQLFMPVAIDITQDGNLLNSLSILAKERGAYAHKYLDRGVVRKSLSPEVAENTIVDCIKLCDEVQKKASEMLKHGLKYTTLPQHTKPQNNSSTHISVVMPQ